MECGVGVYIVVGRGAGGVLGILGFADSGVLSSEAREGCAVDYVSVLCGPFGT